MNVGFFEVNFTSKEAVSKSSELIVPMYISSSENKVYPSGYILRKANFASAKPLFTTLMFITPLLFITGVSAVRDKEISGLEPIVIPITPVFVFLVDEFSSS